MGLFDAIFRPDRAKESQKALKEAKGLFTTLTAYRPAFTTWNGAIYESLIIRSSIDARARHISKLKVETYGTANPSLQSKMRLAPNQWQTWSQFMYRVSTIVDVYSNSKAFSAHGFIFLLFYRKKEFGFIPKLLRPLFNIMHRCLM